MHTLFEGISFTENIFCHIPLVALSIGQKVINAIIQRYPKLLTTRKAAYQQAMFSNNENCVFEKLSFDRTVHEMIPLKLASSENELNNNNNNNLTAIGLTPGGSSIHLHTNSSQNTEDGTHITVTRKKLGSKLTSAGRAPSLRVCLTSEEKVR
jgi:hypothetical protein